ncbi:threonine/homoserine efflux transporter RhtA [Archangium gephyra]|uniref:Threonine/homoserine efflux transporter RhtA n=3 Tax=Archangium gephyra TaxID=48 RepID=A0ABX9JTY3_9BACT|nr:threonine/homoserine efflux transporter RhtA [Archangium gephyra]
MLARSDDRVGQFCMLISMVIAGTIGYFVVNSKQSPLNVVFFRCTIGGAGLVVYCLKRGFFRAIRLSTRQKCTLIAGGLTLVFNWYFLFTAYRLTSIGVTTVVYHFQPFLLLLAGFVFLKERPSASSVAWLLVAFAGLVMIAEPGSERLGASYMLGVASALVAAVLYAATTLLTKTLSGSIRPEPIAASHMIIGALVFSLLADFQHLPGSPVELYSVLTLGVFHTTLMYVLLYTAFTKARTTSIAVLSFAYPLVAVMVDYFAFAKSMGPIQTLGGVLILLAGLAYTNRVRVPFLTVKKVAQAR